MGLSLETTFYDPEAFVAPLHQAKAMRERLRIVQGLEIPEPRWATIVDPRSAVASDAIIGMFSTSAG